MSRPESGSPCRPEQQGQQLVPDAWLLDAADAASARGSQNAEVSLSGRLPQLFTGGSIQVVGCSSQQARSTAWPAACYGGVHYVA